MNTFLSAAQETLKSNYQSIAEKQIMPIAKALEEHKQPLKEVFATLGQAACLNTAVPKEYGGQGGSFLNFALFVEAVAQYEAGLGLSLASHASVIELIKKYGSENQKARYLSALARGEEIATLAFAEVTAGTDFSACQMEARESKGGYSLNGKKVWVVNGEVASLAVVLSRVAEDKLAMFLVDLKSSASLKISANREKLGLRSAFTNDIEFHDHQISAESVLLGDGAEQALFAFDVSQVLIGASAIGLVESATNHAAEHARKREQFGVNIGQFQGIQWKLADMGTECAGARLQVYRAAWAVDENAKDLRLYSAMCKWFAARVARIHSGEALQVMGSFGISEDSPVERFYRDAKVMEIAQGTAEFQKMTIVKQLDI